MLGGEKEGNALGGVFGVHLLIRKGPFRTKRDGKNEDRWHREYESETGAMLNPI